MVTPSRGSRYVEPEGDPLVDERIMCINCDLPKPEGAKWRHLFINTYDEATGVTEELEEWELCPDCDSTQGARLVDYVKFKLS